MTLTVQVDAGTQAGANAYVSVAAFETYAEARNWTSVGDGTYTSPQVEAAIIAATQYVDTIARYKGIQLVEGQSTEFPRDSLVDWNGRTVSGLPQRLKDACCELAYKALTEELYVDLDRGGRISSESVGPISVSYAYNAPAGRTFRAAMQLLAPYVRDFNEQVAPYIGGAAGSPSTLATPGSLEPLFTAGMHSDPEGTE